MSILKVCVGHFKSGIVCLPSSHVFERGVLRIRLFVSTVSCVHANELLTYVAYFLVKNVHEFFLLQYHD